MIDKHTLSREHREVVLDALDKATRVSPMSSAHDRNETLRQKRMIAELIEAQAARIAELEKTQ